MRIRAILSTGLAATVATIGLGSIATAANANVSYDDARVGHVDKGDIQSMLGWNNEEMQANAASIKFTNKLVATTDTTWGCTDGSIQHHYRITTSVRPLAVTADKNKQGKVLGWALNGLSKTDYGTTTEGPHTGGTRFPSFNCPAGTYADFSKYNVAQSHTNDVQVTATGGTFDLPVTPVEVPTV